MQLAAVVYSAGLAGEVDRLFCSVAEALKRDGVRLADVVQRTADCAYSGCASMVLDDVATGRLFDISLPDVADANACSLDPVALEDAVGYVASQLGGVDLVVVNRFGKQEVAGNGFRQVIETAIADGLPVLIALCDVYRNSWLAFTGGDGIELLADRDAIRGWCKKALTEARSARVSAGAQA